MTSNTVQLLSQSFKLLRLSRACYLLWTRAANPDRRGQKTFKGPHQCVSKCELLHSLFIQNLGHFVFLSSTINQLPQSWYLIWREEEGRRRGLTCMKMNSGSFYIWIQLQKHRTVCQSKFKKNSLSSEDDVLTSII